MRIAYQVGDQPLRNGASAANESSPAEDRAHDVDAVLRDGRTPKQTVGVPCLLSERREGVTALETGDGYIATASHEGCIPNMAVELCRQLEGQEVTLTALTRSTRQNIQ